jgi:hypothetical protein
MTTLQRIIAIALIGLFWIGALVAKHFFPDIDVSPFILACGSLLAGLGVHTVNASALASGQQGPAEGLSGPSGALKPVSPGNQTGNALAGFLGLVAILALGVALVGCANMTPQQVNQVKLACATDAGLRPTVDVLLALPGVAKPEEVAAVVAARAIIDPICKNPDAPFAGSGDPYLLVTQATATVTGILVQLQTRAHK